MSAEKTLGQVAFEACFDGGWRGWDAEPYAWKEGWQRIAAAVIAEYERRRVSHVIASSRVVSESGAAVTVTEYELTDNARQGLGLPFDCICECSQQPGLGK